ncbi:hypothetical protein RJ639_046470 [Escallonia herrerae]|uniref:peptide-methionine (S)-S-oxide reductase n=1 Tax=Escallonia herrerae TaxID=1293975 RepID=A0AA89AY07_9ASTE|nr:hypothetical protein RJ639_046470 [Escallonia herrerae]
MKSGQMIRETSILNTVVRKEKTCADIIHLSAKWSRARWEPRGAAAAAERLQGGGYLRQPRQLFPNRRRARAEDRRRMRPELVFPLGMFEAVTHFAGFKALGESVQKPLMYYDNHLIGNIVLFEVVAASGHFHLQPNYIEYDPRLITFRQLLGVFWSSHDSRQVFGQSLDVGNQCRSIIFTNATETPDWLLSAKEDTKRRQRVAS